MANLPLRTELFARYRSAALSVPNTRVTAAEFDRPGSDLNLLGAAGSLLGEEIVNRMARALAGCFEDTATGDALDRIVFDRKQLARLPAVPWVGSIQLQRLTAAAGAGTIDGNFPGGLPAPTRIRTNTGLTYLLLQPANFGALALGPVTVPVQSQLAGLDQGVDANAAWQFMDTVFDTSITISNPVTMAGGDDQESADHYRARSRGFWKTLGRATLGAISYGLKSTPGIATQSVFEVVTPEGFPAAQVQAYVLDRFSRENPSLAARGLLTLLAYRAAGIPVRIFAGVPEYVAIRILLSFDTAVILDSGAAANRVRNAIVAALANQIPGQPLYRTTILAAARSIAGIIIEDTDLLLPAGTLFPSEPSKVFRTLPELIQTN